jgi:hypothetical protein
VSEIRDEVSKSCIDEVNGTSYDPVANQQALSLHRLTLTPPHKLFKIYKRKVKNRKKRHVQFKILKKKGSIKVKNTNVYKNFRKFFKFTTATSRKLLKKKSKISLFFKPKLAVKKKNGLLKKGKSKNHRSKYLHFFSSFRRRVIKKKSSRFFFLYKILNKEKQKKKSVYRFCAALKKFKTKVPIALKPTKSLFGTVLSSSKKWYPPFPLQRPPYFLPKPEYLFFKYIQ